MVICKVVLPFIREASFSYFALIRCEALKHIPNKCWHVIIICKTRLDMVTVQQLEVVHPFTRKESFSYFAVMRLEVFALLQQIGFCQVPWYSHGELLLFLCQLHICFECLYSQSPIAFLHKNMHGILPLADINRNGYIFLHLNTFLWQVYKLSLDWH